VDPEEVIGLSDDDRRAFVVKASQMLRLKLTPRLIEDALAAEVGALRRQVEELQARAKRPWWAIWRFGR